MKKETSTSRRAIAACVFILALAAVYLAVGDRTLWGAWITVAPPVIVFTTFDYLNGRGNATRLARRYGNNYQLVLIDESPVETLRSRLSRNKGKRVLATIPSRDDVVT